jgi:hypothetical protein
MSTNQSACEVWSFMNFQEYNDVHTVVPVYTSNVGGQQMAVIHNGHSDWVLTVGAGETYNVTHHEWFSSCLTAAYWFLVSQLGLDAVDEIANEWSAN